MTWFIIGCYLGGAATYLGVWFGLRANGSPRWD